MCNTWIFHFQNTRGIRSGGSTFVVSFKTATSILHELFDRFGRLARSVALNLTTVQVPSRCQSFLPLEVQHL